MNFSVQKQHRKQRSTEQQKLGRRNGKKNNCMDISSDKLMKSQMRKPGHG